MTKDYSNDLRERIIGYLDAGNGYTSASTLFKVSISSIGRWYRKYKKEGSCLPKKRGGSKRRINLEKLEEYMQVGKDITLKKTAEKFGVSIFTISYWLRKLGYSYKKKSLVTWKQVRKSEISIKNRSKI